MASSTKIAVIDQCAGVDGKVRPVKHLNFEAWSRTLIGFIRHKGLEQELKDWSGGWPCPVGSDPEAPLVYVAAPDLLEALKHARNQIQHPDQLIDEAISKAEGRS